MAFGNLFGSSSSTRDKVSSTDNSSRQNTINTDGSGNIVANERATINLTQTDPGSFAFGEKIASAAFAANAEAGGRFASVTAGFADTLAKVANRETVGLDYRALALPVGLVLAALVAVVLVFRGNK